MEIQIKQKEKDINDIVREYTLAIEEINKELALLSLPLINLNITDLKDVRDALLRYNNAKDEPLSKSFDLIKNTINK